MSQMTRYKCAGCEVDAHCDGLFLPCTCECCPHNHDKNNLLVYDAIHEAIKAEERLIKKRKYHEK